MSTDELVAQKTASCHAIAEHHHLTATPICGRANEASMRRFVSCLPGNALLVRGCGDGRDSRYLATLGLALMPLDLSDGMPAMARCRGPGGDCRRLDFRGLARPDGTCSGIWASGCLYHLTRPEFARCDEFCYALPAPNGVFRPTLKEGEGEHFEDKPGPLCPGGAEAQMWLRGEFMPRLQGFELLPEQRVEPSAGGFELWLRRS